MNDTEITNLHALAEAVGAAVDPATTERRSIELGLVLASGTAGDVRIAACSSGRYYSAQLTDPHYSEVVMISAGTIGTVAALVEAARLALAGGAV